MQPCAFLHHALGAHPPTAHFAGISRFPYLKEWHIKRNSFLGNGCKKTTFWNVALFEKGKKKEHKTGL